MKFWGYIMPPLHVNDFVPTLFTIDKIAKEESRQFFSPIIEENVIVDFIEVEYPSLYISKVEAPVINIKIGDAPIYCFIHEDAEVIIGDINYMKERFLKLLYNGSYDINIQIAIASFFGHTGLIRHLITEINHQARATKQSFYYQLPPTSNYQELVPEKGNLITSKFAALTKEIKKWEFINWTNLLFFDKDFIYFDTYRCNYKVFFKFVPNAKEISQLYLNALSQDVRDELIVSNLTLYSKILFDRNFMQNQKLVDKTSTENKYIAYLIEDSLSATNKKASKHIRRKKRGARVDPNAVKQELKNIKLKFRHEYNS